MGSRTGRTQSPSVPQSSDQSFVPPAHSSCHSLSPSRRAGRGSEAANSAKLGLLPHSSRTTATPFPLLTPILTLSVSFGNDTAESASKQSFSFLA